MQRARLSQPVARLFLTLFSRLTSFSRAPLVGPLLRSLSRAILPLHARIWVRVRKGPARGLWIGVNPRTGRELYQGAVERVVQEALTKHLGSGMVLYDIGANVGLFTLIGARCVGRGGRVFAFEPDPDVCQRLRENVLRNGLSNVEVVQAAVAADTGSSDFLRAHPDVSPDMGLGRIGVPLPSSSAIQVRTIALDDFARGARSPDVIKCDVEGSEVEVLEGARSLLKQQGPVVICEVHSESGAASLTRLLALTGYNVRWLDSNHLFASPQAEIPDFLE